MLLSYHNDPALKASALAEMAEHRRQERLVQGYGYWRDGKGCAVGCLIKGDDHALYEQRFGIPVELAHLEDRIFEGLPRRAAIAWPERFLGAIPVGADLSRVRWQFCAWLLTDAEVNPGIADETVSAAVKGVADLCLRAAMGEMPAEDEWSAAEAAWSAAAAAAESAAWAAAEAAWSAAAAAAWSAAAWERMSERLLALLAATEGSRP